MNKNIDHCGRSEDGCLYFVEYTCTCPECPRIAPPAAPLEAEDLARAVEGWFEWPPESIREALRAFRARYPRQP